MNRFENDVMELEQNALLELSASPLQNSLTHIVIPEFAKIDHSKKYKVTNHRNYDQESPFNPAELLGATHLNGIDLAQQANQIDIGAEIALPSWHFECKSDQIRLKFCHSADYENYIVTKEDEKDQVEISQELQRETEITKITDDTGDVSISEEDNMRIENLSVSQQTKDLIREKYYRGANHIDLQSFKVFDKNTSSLFYELFSVIFREKPAFEFEDVPNNLKGPKEYIAHMVFNNERLVQGQSNSKKDAKALASLRALEIFAPSLAGKHQQFIKVPEHSNVSAFLEDIKIHDLPVKPLPQKSTKPQEVVSHFEEEKKTAEADSGSEVIEIEEISNLPFFQENSKTSIFNDEDRGSGLFEYTQEEMQKTLNEYDKIPAKKIIPSALIATAPLQKSDPEVQVNFNSVNGLKVTVSTMENRNSNSQNPRSSQDVLSDGRDKSIKKLFDDLSEFLKTSLKPRIDPKAPLSPDMAKAFKSYCQNRIFTKLYMLHCLINKKEHENLQINSLYYENECHIYLYSSELNQTFMYRSSSFVFGVEAAKYFLIFSIYDKCQTIPEIMSSMRAKKEQIDLNSEYHKFNKPNQTNDSKKLAYPPSKESQENQPSLINNTQKGESSDEIQEIESIDFVSSKAPTQSQQHSRISQSRDSFEGHKNSFTKGSSSPRKKPSVKDRMLQELDFL